MLTVDSIFMMPHLGVLSEHLYAAAKEVFERDCIVKIGTCIAPVGTGKDGEPCVRVEGAGVNVAVPFGEIRVVPYTLAQGDTMTITPEKNFDVGVGKGKPVTVKRFDTNRGSRDQTTNLIEGQVGLIIDTRGRPFNLDLATPNRINKLRSYLSALSLPLP
jgi:hypothetical protein